MIVERPGDEAHGQDVASHGTPCSWFRKEKGDFDSAIVVGPRTQLCWDGESDLDRAPECDVGAVERAPGMIFFDCFECGYTTPRSSSHP